VRAHAQPQLNPTKRSILRRPNVLLIALFARL